MILSFPIDAWALLFVAVGLGLGLELAFYRARRGGGAHGPDATPEPASRREPGASDRGGDA